LCVKFADDFFIAGFMSTLSDFNIYQNSINHITGQLSDIDLRLNDDKKKEIIFDFTVNQRITDNLPLTLVQNDTVERVAILRMLGYHFNEIFTSADHVSFLLNKVKPRLFLLYKMVSMRLPKEVLIPFYIGAIRSPLEFATPAFHYSLTAVEAKSLERIQKRAFKSLNRDKFVLGYPQASTLAKRREETCTLVFEKLLSQSSSVIGSLKTVRRGNMLPIDITRTKRYEKTLIPSQTSDFNQRNIKNPATQRAHACFSKH
jgi:hypothetical protein